MVKTQVLSPIPSNIAKNRNHNIQQQKKTNTTTEMALNAASKDLRSSSSSFSSKNNNDNEINHHHRLPRQRKASIISISSCSSSASSSSNQEFKQEQEEEDEEDHKEMNFNEKEKNQKRGKNDAKQEKQQSQQKNPKDKTSTITGSKRTRQAFVEIFSPVRAMRVARAGMKRKHGHQSGAGGGVNGRIMNTNRVAATAARQVGRGVQNSGSGSSSSTGSNNVNGKSKRKDSTLPKTEEESNDNAIISWNEIFKNHHQSLTPTEQQSKYPPRPKHQSREPSGSSLRRNMRAMRLSDRDEMEQDRPIISSRRSSSRSIQRFASSTSGSRKPSMGNSSRGDSRSRRVSKAEEDQLMKDGEQEEEDADDIEGEMSENEKKRLLRQAPSWQLRRLTKDKLFALHVFLGTFQSAQLVELDSFNKQDLVDGIIHSRSQDEPPSSIGSSLDQSTSERSSRTHSINSPTHPMMKRSTTNNSIVSRSSEYTDETEVQSESDANDAAGEETEVEPVKRNRKKMFTPSTMYGDRQRDLFRKRTTQGNVLSFPIKQDYQNDGSSTRSSSVISPMRRRLRHKGSLVFAASSPIRTRARTRTQTLNDSSLPFHQRNLRTRAYEELRLDQMTTPKPNNRRIVNVGGIQETDFDNERDSSSEAENEIDNSLRKQGKEDEMDDWEDTSPSVARKRSNRTPRKAKLRAKAQLHQTLEEDSEAMVESVLIGEVEGEETDGMSFDETISISKKKFPKRVTSGSSPPWSEMSLDDDDDEEDGDANEILDLSDSDEDDEHDKPSDLDVSPSKMRKLRNGKLRLPNILPTHKEKEDVFDTPLSTEKVKDTEMDEEEQQDFTSTALNRLKRDKLIELCQQDSLSHAKDATRAILIDTLLDHHGHDNDKLASSRTERPDSASSSRTARPESSARTDSSRGRRKGTGSDKPLLLRTRSLKHESHSKPGTPTPSQNEEDLNGLDLESLQLVDKEIAFNKLEKLDKIGSGGFKDVYVGKYHISKKTVRKVAIADIRDQLSEMDIKELTLLRDLKHENIVRFIGVCIPPAEMRLTPCMIVSELCANGDLYDYVRNVDAPPDEEIFRIMLETARGLEYLHLRTPAIIHRDCKSSNVLITRGKTAKINDFGLARVRNSKRSMIKSLVGTVNWQAVELWTPKPSYNEKVDVWSAAMTFWEALQWHQPEKKYPFQDMNEHQIYQDVGQKKLRPPTISIRRRYGSEIVELLDRMWDQNPKLRPTMTEVCEEMERLVQLKKDAASAAAEILSAETDSKDNINNKKKANTTTTRNASR